MMLYSRHLGLKGRLEDLIAAGDTKAIELRRTVKELEDIVLGENLLRARAMYRFYPAHDDNGTLVIVDPQSGDDVARFAFPRQAGGEMRCLNDLVQPKGKHRDHVGVFVTSCQGRRKSVRDLADSFKSAGQFVRMHALQALAIETAEGMAEWVHERMRSLWGIGDAATTTKRELFQAHYRGRRYSFGYPACPRLEDQHVLWKFFEPHQHIGVELTEGFMMDPEASVSALVFQHPQATYFSTAGELDDDS
jgi:5-methyltetrahydrofolate--homocysteine methyltransferase